MPNVTTAFHHSVSRFPVDDSAVSTRLDIKCAVANDELSFVARGDSFSASYEMSAVVSSENGGRQVAGVSWRRAVAVHRFEETNSAREFDVSDRSLVVPPGRYHLLLQMVDLESGRLSRVGTSVIASVPRDAEEPRLSDVLLLRTADPNCEPAEEVLIPGLREADEPRSPLSACIEVLMPLLPRPGRLSWRISDPKGRLVLTDSVAVDSLRRVFRRLIPLGTVLEAGDYRLDISMKAGRKCAKAQKEFTVAGEPAKLSFEALSRAIDQLVYTIGQDSVERMKRLPPEQRREAFNGFWARMDPSPKTPENELMQEYYSRVASVDRFLSAAPGKGWRTDRGGIYILYGRPDQIEDYPPDPRFRGPYQVWRYYLLDRTFTFADVSGFGQYSLVSH